MINTLLHPSVPARPQEAAGRIDKVAESNKENDDETPLEMVPRLDFEGGQEKDGEGEEMAFSAPLIV